MLKALTKIKLYVFILLLFPWVLVAGQGNGLVVGTINTPLNSSIGTIPGLIKVVLGAILNLAVPIIVLAFVYVGFLFVKSQGNDGELTKAKEALLYVVIGTIVIIASNAAYNIFLAGYTS